MYGHRSTVQTNRVVFFHQTLTSASHKEGTISHRTHRLPRIFQGNALSFGGEQCDHEPCVGPLILEPFSAVAVPSATGSHVSPHWRPAPPCPWYVPRDLTRSANPPPPEKLPLRWAQKPVICRGAKNYAKLCGGYFEWWVSPQTHHCLLTEIIITPRKRPWSSQLLDLTKSSGWATCNKINPQMTWTISWLVHK